MTHTDETVRMAFPDDVPVLSNGVVTLRAHWLADVPRVVEQCADPQTVRFTTVPTPYGEAQARAFVEQRVANGWADDVAWCFAIEHDGRFAGSIDQSSSPRMQPGDQTKRVIFTRLFVCGGTKDVIVTLTRRPDVDRRGVDLRGAGEIRRTDPNFGPARRL